MANISLTLRRPKGVHLTIDEVDANFLNLKNGIIAEEQARIAAINALLDAFAKDIAIERDQRIAQDNYLLSLIQSEMAIREAQDRALDAKIDASVDQYKVFSINSASPTPNLFKSRTISGFEAYASTDFPPAPPYSGGPEGNLGLFYCGLTVSGTDSTMSAQLAFNWNSEESAPGGLFFRTNDDTANRLAWSPWTKIWNENNDGSGSGLDADKLDGVHAKSFGRINLASSAEWKLGHMPNNEYGYYKIPSPDPELPFWSMGDHGTGGIGQGADGPITSAPQYVWFIRSGDTATDADGGWVKVVDGIDDTKCYMSVVYIKRMRNYETGIESTNGFVYHGLGGRVGLSIQDMYYTAGTSFVDPEGARNGTNTSALPDSNTIQLSSGYGIPAGSPNPNPYWLDSGVSVLPLGVWCVSVGFLSFNTHLIEHDYDMGGGLYRLDTGERILKYGNFKNAPGTKRQIHRAFVYYSTDPNLEIHFSSPGFYEINGTEPSFAELLGGKSITSGSEGLDTFKFFQNGVDSPSPASFKVGSISGFEAYTSSDFPYYPPGGGNTGKNFYCGITVTGKSGPNASGLRSAQLAFNWNSEESPPGGLFFRTNDDTADAVKWSPWTKIWNEVNDVDLINKIMAGSYTVYNKLFVNYKETLVDHNAVNGSTVTIETNNGTLHRIRNASGLSTAFVTIQFSGTFLTGCNALLNIDRSITINWNIDPTVMRWQTSNGLPPVLSSTRNNSVAFVHMGEYVIGAMIGQ